MLFGREYMPEGAGVDLWLGSYYWMQNALFDAPVSKKLSNCVRMLLGFLHRPFGSIPAGVLAADGSCHSALCVCFSADRIVGAQPAGDAGSVCPH